MLRQPPRSTLFPSTTLFRSWTSAGLTPTFFATSLHRCAISSSDRKSTRLNSSHLGISYAVFCLKNIRRSGRLFNATATTEIYTLSLHDALPILDVCRIDTHLLRDVAPPVRDQLIRSEEHTSELQSLRHLVCRLLLEKHKAERPSVQCYGNHRDLHSFPPRRSSDLGRLQD